MTKKQVKDKNAYRREFITAITDSNYSFIKELTPINTQNEQLNNDFNYWIVDYTTRKSALLELLKNDTVSKTEKIIAIYHFNQENQKNLIPQFIQASRNIWQQKAEKDTYINLAAQLKEILKTGRKFNQWALTLLPDKKSSISRNTKDARTYDENAKLDPTPATDKERVKAGVGLPLPPRLAPERLDPKHRAWGTMYPSIAHTLQPVFENWVEGTNNEDLTVEIEFTEKLQQIDENFNPEQSADSTRDPSDPSWFNSMNFYCTPIQALEYLAITKDDKLYHGVSPLLLDTKGENGDRFIFTMDMQGNLFLNKQDDYRDGKRISHPSFIRGEEVACAGEITVRNGKVSYINNSSGHYQPGGYSLYRVINELEKRGVLAPECKIQVMKDDDFVYRTEDTHAHKMSLAQYKEVYQKNTADIKVPPITLTAQVNPLALLNCLGKINHYLTKRAGETNRFLSFFGAYSGNDYFKRRQNFMDIISNMKEAPEAVMLFIAQSQSQFQKGRRSEYANLLAELHDIISANTLSVLTHPLVEDTLKTHQTMHAGLKEHETMHRRYQKNSTANKDMERGEIAEAKASYGFLRKELTPELRSQYAKEEDMEKLQRHNVKYL